MKTLYYTLERSGDARQRDDVNEVLADGTEYWQERAITAEGGAVLITYFFTAEDVANAGGEAEHCPWSDRVVSIAKT